MNTIRMEGIILQSLPVKDWDLLISALTKECGIVKFYYKNGQSNKRRKGSLTSPLTCGEFIGRAGNSDLIALNEISVIDSHFELRKTLECLNYSCSWLKLVRRSQLPGKPVPELYQLLRTFLRALPAFSTPGALHACFQLKLLRHEGSLEINSHCSVCAAAATFQAEESFCGSHCPQTAVPFNRNELETLETLALCRSLKEIEHIQVFPSLLERTAVLYENVSMHFCA